MGVHLGSRYVTSYILRESTPYGPRRPNTPLKILIDPGHGGSDPGAVAFGTNESDINLAFGLELRDCLEKLEKVEVHMTRSTDAHMSLEARVHESVKWQPDLFISIHTNAGKGTGMESYVRLKPIDEEVAIQQALHSQVMKYNKTQGVVDRGMKKEDFYVLKVNPRPSIMFELLFIDTKKDFDLLMNDKYKHGWCNELTYAIKVYYKLESKPEEVEVEGSLSDLFSNIVRSLRDVIDEIGRFKA